MYSNEKYYTSDPTTFSSPSQPPPPVYKTSTPTSQQPEGVNESPKWKDIGFAIAFYAHLLLSFAITAYCSYNLDFSFSSKAGKLTDFDPIKPYLKTTILSFLSAFTVLSCSLALMRKKAETFLRVSYLTVITLFAASAIYILFSGKFSELSMVFAGINLLLAFLAFFFYRRNDALFAFSAAILEQIEKANAAYSGIWVLAAGNLLAVIVYGFYFVFSIFSIMLFDKVKLEYKWIPYLYTIFSFYWTTQVIGNVFQTSFAGVYATYFFSGPPADSANHKTCVNSLYRASTYSFGSICFGSLIVASLQFLRYLLQSFKNSSRNDRDLVTAICILVSAVILDTVESLVEYFNYYAYTYIAIYGKGYLESAKDTWELVKSSGVSAVINDNLISHCLFLTCLSLVGLNALFCYLDNADAASYFISLMITLLSCCAFCNIITSGATTLFVCLAESPQKFRSVEPEMYSMTLEKYPELIVA